MALVEDRRLLVESHFLVPLLTCALELVGDPALVADSDGNIVYANERARGLIAEDSSGTVREVKRAVRDRGSARFTARRVAGRQSARGPSCYFVLVGRQGVRPCPVLSAGAALGLSRRQQEVLGLVVDGQANATIASILEISVRTVEVHVSALLERCGVESRSALVAKVLAPNGVTAIG